MIELERRVLLKHYLDQGLTKTAIAERLGISRRTIHHWIQTGQLERDLDRERVRYKPRPPVATTLDPYKPIIRQRLETYPELTAVRLFEEVKAAGYPGCLTQLKVFVRQIRPRPSQTQPSFDAWIYLEVVNTTISSTTSIRGRAPLAKGAMEGSVSGIGCGRLTGAAGASVEAEPCRHSSRDTVTESCHASCSHPRHRRPSAAR